MSRTAILSFRLTTEQYALLCKAAAAAGLSLSDYVRRAVRRPDPTVTISGPVFDANVPMQVTGGPQVSPWLGRLT